MNLPDRWLALAGDPLTTLHPARLRLAAWAAGVLLVSACQAQPVAPADEAALLARLRDEIGDARCSADSQCRTLGVGHKACGGPQQWWAWSIVSARGERLQAWADELAALQKQRQEASGMQSNCLYVADPGAVCQAQRCVLRSSAAGNAR
jgi:hypothetical protein